MTMQRHTVRPNASRAPRAVLLGACALLLVLGGWGALRPNCRPARRCSSTPTTSTPQPFPTHRRAGWPFNWDFVDGDFGDWELYTSSLSCAQDRWLPRAIREDDSDQPNGRDGQHILVVRKPSRAARSSTPTRPTSASSSISRAVATRGLAPRGPSPTATVIKLVDDAYLFYFSDLPRYDIGPRLRRRSGTSSSAKPVSTPRSQPAWSTPPPYPNWSSTSPLPETPATGCGWISSAAIPGCR